MDEYRDLTTYLFNSLSVIAEKKPICRGELLEAAGNICIFLFTVESHLSIKGQCEEIDEFCIFLKSYAMKDAVRS